MKLERLVFAAVMAGAALFAGQAGEGLAPYPSPAEVEAEIMALSLRHPDQAEVFGLGPTASGREILAARIHQGDGKERPAALIAGAIHGNEYIANRAVMAAARLLLDSGESVAAEVLSRMDVYLLPLINPDGYEAAWESRGEGPTKQTRTNSRGVDLNRNFGKPENHIPLPWGYSGSEDPDSDRWTGPAPESEPETQAVLALAREKKFFAAVDFHSTWGMIIPMLADDPVTQRGLRRMALAYWKAQEDKYLIVMFPWWLPLYQGSMEEGLHRVAGTLPLLIELCKEGDLDPRKKRENHFWSFNPAEAEVMARVAEDNARAALFALLAGYEYKFGERGRASR